MWDKYAELGQGMTMMTGKVNHEDYEDEDDEDNKDAGQGWGTRMWTMRYNGQRGARLVIPAGILWTPVFSIPVALFSQE